MCGSKCNKFVLLLITLFISVVVIVIWISWGKISAFLSNYTDMSPPYVVFSFQTVGDQHSLGNVVVVPGEEFTPLIDVQDDTDPSPRVKTWMVHINGNAFAQNLDTLDGDPVVMGEPMSIADSGLYTIYARVTDKAGNTMTYSSIVRVNNQPISDAETFP